MMAIGQGLERSITFKGKDTMVKNKKEFSFEIIETLAVLSEGSRGWSKEFNLVSWNGREPKYDIRDWSEGHDKMGKGITFSLTELEKLKQALADIEELN